MTTTDKAIEVASKAVDKVSNVDTSPLQEKLVSMLDALQEGAIQIGNTAVKYAPDVGEAVLAITRINSLAELVPAILTVIAACICFKYYMRLWSWSKKIANEECDGFVYIVPVTFTIFYVAVTNFAVRTLIDVWLWIGVFEPKLYIAKQIVDSVLTK